ncbi:MAG TPA: hypothetical protein VFX65_14420 [Candidatus Limnocylindrales bacterium]|nr:hypothetical protein [Candidatus Limnocylindrales bacterium]
MQLFRHVVPIVALVLLVGACGTTAGGTPTAPPSATSSPASEAPTDATPAPTATAAAPTTTPVSLADLGGTWTLVASNPHVVAATGGHAGGSIVISGDRYTFTAGDYSSDAPIEFSGTGDVTCTASSCRIDGVPLHHVFLVDGQLAILNAAMLTPLGSFGDTCAGWEDIPDGGVITVLETGTVAGVEVPTVLRFADGDAGGVGAACESGSHTVAWDVTATRQP